MHGMSGLNNSELIYETSWSWRRLGVWGCLSSVGRGRNSQWRGSYPVDFDRWIVIEVDVEKIDR